ncbi:MAG: PfkB family carbohydrate kinase, partial [Guyparkeria sp.]
DQPISLEVEKDRPELDQLWPFPDIIFLSAAFARARGFDDPEAFLKQVRAWAPQAILVLGWGASGAWLSRPDGEPEHVPARPVESVVDSIGAGDTLIAGFIHARSTGQGSREALEFAVRLAERKIGQQGFAGLGPEDPAEDPHLLCRLEDLDDLDALGVTPRGHTGPVDELIVTRDGERVCAWRNVCPHNGSPLSRDHHDFLEPHEGVPRLRCNVHQAYFRLEDGLCIEGPCEGERLQPVEIERVGNRIYLARPPG